MAIGVERPVSTPDLEPLARTGRVAITTNGVTTLAVWTDRRSDRGVEIVAARMDTAARILDPRGFAITDTPDVDEDLPFVEFDGFASFVVVWAAGENTMAAKVNASGVIITGPLLLAQGRPEGLALVGRDMAIAIADSGGTNIALLRSDLALRQVTRLGRVQDVEVTALGNGIAVVWLEEEFNTGLRVVRAMRIDSRRIPIDTVTVTQLGKFEPPATLAVGTHDDDAIIAAAAKNHFGVVRLEPDGTITTLSSNNAEETRRVEDVVARESSGFDLLAVIDGHSRVIRYTGNSITGEFEPVAIDATDGAGIFAERTLTIWNVGGAVTGRFAFTDAQEPPFVISQSPASQQMPALTTDGAMALAVWAEDVNDTGERVMGRLLALDGTADAAAKLLTLGTRTMTPGQSPPAATFAANNYFVAFADQRNGPQKPAHLLLRTLNRSGVLFGLQQVSTSAHPTDRVAMANALMVWSEQVQTAREMRASFVTQPLAHIPIPATIGEPAVAFGENGYVVAGTTSFRTIRGTFVANDGTTRLLFETIPPFGSIDSEPAVAWSPRGTFLVVFKRDGNLRGRLLDRRGVPSGDDFPLVANGDNPSAVWDGHAFLVSWNAGAELNVMRVLIKGIAQPAVVLTSSSDRAAMVTVGDGRVLVAYQRMVPELLNVHRVFTRTVTGPAIPLTPGKQRSVRK